MRLAIEDEYQRLRACGQPNGNAQIVGYILVAYDGSAANATVDVVDVVMTSADLVGQFILFRVTLLWPRTTGGCWRPHRAAGEWSPHVGCSARRPARTRGEVVAGGEGVGVLGTELRLPGLPWVASSKAMASWWVDGGVLLGRVSCPLASGLLVVGRPRTPIGPPGPPRRSAGANIWRVLRVLSDESRRVGTSDAAGVFISYRRQEASYLAGWLHDRLADRFGEPRVFLDIDSIRPGVDFRAAIGQAIARSRAVLVLIGPKWLVSDLEGRRRLDQPDDPVRVELEASLRGGVRVIPLLLDGAVMPQAHEVPDTVATVTRLNALRVGYESFRTDVARLVRTLEEVLGATPSPVADEVTEPTPPRHGRRTWMVGSAPSGMREVEQRARLLSRLSRTYNQFLSQSVESDGLRLNPDLEWRPGQTFRPQDRVLPIPAAKAEGPPASTSLMEALEEAGGLHGDGLLVLGEPGAGKTTLLVQLARQLAERAHADPEHPLPVYLPLSTWSSGRARVGEWLADQLEELYQVPPELGHRWTDEGRLLFLLDGLDEIPTRDDRAACVMAVNRFNRFGRTCRLPTVVTSRQVEYDALPRRLQLESAVSVRPLDPTAVLEDLRRAGPGLRGAVAVIERDPQLLELLRVPLLVGMLTLAYADVPGTDIHASADTPLDRRHRLLTDYVNRRFELGSPGSDRDRRAPTAYPREQTCSWLSALALNLTGHQQTVFLLGRLEPDWLPSRWARWAVIAAPGLFGALIAALIWVSLTGLSGGGLTVALAGGLGVGLIAALGAGLGVALLEQSNSVERLSWSWHRARSRLRVALVGGLIIGGANVTFAVTARFRETNGVGAGLSLALTGLSLALTGLTFGLTGLRAGLRTGLSVGILLGCIAAPSVGLPNGILFGLIIGLIGGLAAGLVGNPQPVERLSWSWTLARSRLPSALLVGLFFGLVIGVMFGLPNLSFSPAYALREALFNLLFFGLVAGLGAAVVGGMSPGLMPLYVTPNEGIRRSLRNGFVIFLMVGLLVGSIVWLIDRSTNGPVAGLLTGLIVGTVVGGIAGLAYGIGAAVQHGLLRLLLWRYHRAPLRYVRWLDYTVHLRLLYRGTGGGYVFIHRIVQEYFADLARLE